MNPTLDLEIHSQLTSHTDIPLLIDQLENYTDWSTLPFQELTSLCLFYIKTGFAGQLVQTLSLRLGQLPKFPWAHFALALREAIRPTPLPESLAKLIINSSRMDESTLELVRADFMRTFDSSLNEFRDKLSEGRENYQKTMSEEIQGQVDLMRSQGLLEQEEKIIQKWLRFFPEDPKAHDALSSVRERRFEDSAQRTENRPPVAVEKKSRDEIRILEIVERSQQHILETLPDLARDFSMSHIFWDNPSAALRFLEALPLEPGRPEQNFLRIDLYLKSHQYVRALEAIDRMEPLTKARPELLDHCLLYRGKAMWGLQQRAKALELIRILAHQRPDFYAAQLLLDEMEDELR